MGQTSGILADLKTFLDDSPTASFAVDSLTKSLDRKGFIRLQEENPWELERKVGYYVIRDGRAVMAFVPGLGDSGDTGYKIMTAHVDSPLWKIKTEGASRKAGQWRLPVEVYGGPIRRTWLDRELEIAGQVVVTDGAKLTVRNWRSGEPMGIIPSLAVHLDREVNEGTELNAQDHMALVLPHSSSTNPLVSRIADDWEVSEDRILSAELFAVPVGNTSTIRGIDDDFIVSGRLDNLAMAHAILTGLPDPSTLADQGWIAAWFDGEEIGSKTPSGADSSFLDDVLERLELAKGGGREELLRAKAQSFMVSADMAHALHPNYPGSHDEAYAPLLGGGPVLKSHGLRHYATDVFTEGLVASVAKQHNLPLQKFIVHSNLPCGYSLGPLAASRTGIRTVDLGNPLWAMHSARETASLRDHQAMIRLMSALWSSDIEPFA